MDLMNFRKYTLGSNSKTITNQNAISYPRQCISSQAWLRPRSQSQIYDLPLGNARQHSTGPQIGGRQEIQQACGSRSECAIEIRSHRFSEIPLQQILQGRYGKALQATGSVRSQVACW